MLGYVDTELGDPGDRSRTEDAGTHTQGFQRGDAAHADPSSNRVGGGWRHHPGANVLVAIFSEPESHAAYFLQEQGVCLADAVNVITRGAADRGGEAY